MRICVFGAGAIGGLIAARLTGTDAEVSCIARGPHLAAMRAHGLRVRAGGEESAYAVHCTDDPAALGEQDYVVLALKAHSVSAATDSLAPLLGPDTAVVTAQNGVPWWYFYRQGGPLENRRLVSLDPDGRLWNNIGPERAIGCVVYPAAEIVEPGVIVHQYGDRLTLGEPDGSRSERVKALAGLLNAAGFRAPVRTRIRDDIWLKLWGNLSFNPLSVLTHATLAALAADAGVKPILRAMMTEAHGVGTALGAKFAVDLDTRIRGAAEVGEHKTSMLQDLERGRPLEIDANVTAVQELGQIAGAPTPMIDVVLALVQLRARVAGLYGR